MVRSKFIVDLAKEKGWDEFKFIKDKIEELGAKKYTKNTMVEDPRQQARDFLEESVADLYQLKNKDPLSYDDVVKELVKQTGYGKRIINDAIKKAGESIRKEKSITIPPGVEALFDGMKEFIYLEDHGRSHLTQVVMDKKNGFTRSKTTPRALKEAMYAGYEVYRYDPEGGIEVINFIDYWNQPFKYGHNRGPGIYKKIDFDPSPEPEAGIYNLFDDFPLQPVYDKHITDFLEFLLIHVCGKDKEAYDFFLSFFAHLVQYPWLLIFGASFLS